MSAQDGFLLSYLKFGESDAVVHSFTREKGFQNFFVKGMYSSKNKKKAYLFPLNELCFVELGQHKAGSIQNISKIELIKNPDFHNDVKANTIIFFIADFLNQILRNENQSEKIYNGISNFIKNLEEKNYQSHLIFLFIFLKIQGFSPLYSEDQFLDPEAGAFSGQRKHPIFDEKISEIWKKSISTENMYELKFPKDFRKQVLDSLMVYYHYHIADFRTPASLEIVQQIFE